MPNKINELQTILASESHDVLCLTETWCDGNIPDNAVNLPGYNIIRNDRQSNQRGGGVACMIKDGIPFKRWHDLESPEFESLWITLRPPRMPRSNSHILLGVIYHPPKANNWLLSRHICTTIDTIRQKHPNAGIMLTGDVNHFKDSPLKSSFKVTQIVTKPTRGDRILDKMYTNMLEFYNSVSVQSPIGASDHNVVICRPQPTTMTQTPKFKTIEKRASGHNEKTLFVHALKNTDWSPIYNMSSCTDQYEFFDRVISELMDTFMPVKLRKIHTNPDKPWITSAFKAAIDRRQRAFQAGDIVTYKMLRNKVNHMSKSLKPKYYRNHVEQLKNTKPNKWWSTVKSFMGNTKPDSSQSLQSLANSESNGDLAALANKLNSFFQSISTDLPQLDPTINCNPQETVPNRFIISVEDVEKRLLKTNIRKAVGPDNIPNWVLSDCAP